MVYFVIFKINFQCLFFGFYKEGVCKIVTKENLFVHLLLHVACQNDNDP